MKIPMLELLKMVDSVANVQLILKLPFDGPLSGFVERDLIFPQQKSSLLNVPSRLNFAFAKLNLHKCLVKLTFAS